MFIDYLTYGHVNIGISYTEKKEVRVLLKQVSCSIVSYLGVIMLYYSIIELLGRNASFDPLCFFIIFNGNFSFSKNKIMILFSTKGEEPLSSCMYFPSALHVLAHFVSIQSSNQHPEVIVNSSIHMRSFLLL